MSRRYQQKTKNKGNNNSLIMKRETKADGSSKDEGTITKDQIKCNFCCSLIMKRYIRSHLQKYHQEHTKILNFPCEICNKIFAGKKNLNVHISFLLNALKYHLKIHNKKFMCQICSKLHPSQSSVNQHMKVYHHNPKSFECQNCGKKFHRKYNLECHQKLHDKNRPKPFKCERCDYTTDRKYHFNVHQKSHENRDKKFAAIDNPKKCEKCSACFENVKVLRLHKIRVHQNIKFQCDLCGNYIKSKIKLTKHIQKKLCQKKLKF